MGYDLTRQSMVWTLLMFVLLMLLFWARSLLYPVEVTLSTVGEMPPGVMVDGFSENYPRWGGGLAAGFMLAGGLALCRVVTRNMILLERIYMPLQIYLIVACGS